MHEDILSLCRKYTDLSPADQELTARYAAELPAIAELCGTDVFLDCLCRGGSEAIVVAEARRRDGTSLYQEDVVGKLALPDKEPGVFRAFRTGKPSRELRAVSQENVPVQQNAVPLFNEAGDVFAVMIREKNIQERLDYNRKYEEVSQTNQRLVETLASLGGPDSSDVFSSHYLAVQLSEMNHRIKNNLQMLSSIMSMEARRCGNAQAEMILGKNVGRILAVAALHEMMSSPNAGTEVELKPLIRRVAECALTCLPSDECEVEFDITGGDLTVSAELAGALMLVVNELITNSVKHAFPGRDRGRIEIDLKENPPYHSLIISDDGIGFEGDIEKQASLGLNIVKATVRDKIKGVLSISSGIPGSGRGLSARIDF